MAHTGKILFGLLVVFLGYVGFAPIDNFDPQSSIPNVYLPYHDDIVDHTFAKNMVSFRHPEMFTPEDIEVDEQTGVIYTALKNGNIVTIENSKLSVIAKGQGMVLGVKLSPDRRYLYFADLKAGMCRLDLASKQIEVLTNGYKGTPFNFLDNFDVAADGKIYMTQASDKYKEQEFFMDLFEGRPHGQIYVYDPSTKATELLLDGLYFPNGIAVSPDQQSLYFSETFANRLSKYILKGDQAGTYVSVLEGLPGSPDNIKFNSKGQLWVAIPSFRDALSDKLLKFLPIKRLLARLPGWIHEELVNTREMGGILVDVNRMRLLKILRSKEVSKIKMVTTILEKNDTLYFGSVSDNALGIVKLSDLKQSAQEETQQL